MRANEVMRRNKGVKVTESERDRRTHQKIFANSEGAYLEQTIYESGGSIAATAVNDTEVQIRRIPIHSGIREPAAGNT